MPTWIEYQLIDEFEGYLHRIRRLTRADAGQLERIGAWVPFTLFEYLLATANTILLLLRQDMWDQCRPLMRSMFSAAFNVLAICGDDEADGVALQFVLHAVSVRRRRFRRLQRTGAIEQELADDMERKENLREADIIADLKRKYGVEPVWFGARSDTWSGLSDEELAEMVGASDWCLDYYGPLSDASHVNVAGIWKHLRLRTGGTMIHDSLVEILDPVVDVVDTSSAALIGRLGLRRKEALEKATEHFRKERFKFVNTDIFGPERRPARSDDIDG